MFSHSLISMHPVWAVLSLKPLQAFITQDFQRINFKPSSIEFRSFESISGSDITRLKLNQARPLSQVLNLSSKQSLSDASPLESFWDTIFDWHVSCYMTYNLYDIFYVTVTCRSFRAIVDRMNDETDCSTSKNMTLILNFIWNYTIEIQMKRITK